MEVEPVEVIILCLFCDSPLVGEEDAEFETGDMIKCTGCGEGNDYDSVLEVAKEKGMVEMEKRASKAIEKELSKLFK